MLTRSLRVVTLFALMASVAGCDCGATVFGLGSTSLLISTPENGDQVGAGQTVTFKATATNPNGLGRLSLYAGAPTTVACKSPADCAVGLTCDEASVCIPDDLNTCTGAAGSPTLNCEASLAVGHNPALIVNGQIQLTAIVVDRSNVVLQKSVTVYVKPVSIAFTQPTIPPGTAPPVAVSGESPVAVAVSSALPLASVVITYDGGKPLAQWLNNPTGSAFEQDVVWEETMGVGEHQLVAVATDSVGNVANAVLDVQIGTALTINFTAPTISAGTAPPVADVGGLSPVAVAVVHVLPLASVVITSETGATLAQWPTNPTGNAFSEVVNWNAALGAGTHQLTATATDSAGETATATLSVVVAPPTIVFTAPTILPGSSPPFANVAGTSPVAVAVTSALPLQSVVITYGPGMTLASWANPTGTTFQEIIDWNMTLGVGTFTLTATATDTANEVATATLTVSVGLPTIVFTEPTLTPGLTPPIALVAAPSPVGVAITGPLPFKTVSITYDMGLPLASWSNPTGSTFHMTVDWIVQMGAGVHTLTGTATDVGGNVATATLTVQVGVPTIVFTQPTAVAGTTPPLADVFGTSPVAVQVTSPVALASVVITSETGIILGSWVSPTGTAFSQPVAWATALGPGPHTLTATATDISAQVATATLSIVVEVPTIVFTQPVIPAGASVADVFGSSPVAVQVTSPAPLSSVTITSETGINLGSWASPVGTTFSQTVAWAVTLGPGPHTLTATATDVSPAVATATLDIVVEGPTIVFTQPVIPAGASAASVFGSSPVAVQVTSPAPLASVTITSETGITLATWPSPSGSAFSQTIAWATLLGPGPHTLTATATDTSLAVATATLNIVVEVPTIVFTQPTPAAGATVADVFGSSPVAVQVTSPAALSSVTITSEAGVVLGSWTSPTATSFSQTINWAATLGVGPHTLTATATDVSPQTATATLNILVEAPTIVFTQPTLAAGATVADVFGSSPVAVQVTSPAALSSVTITSETGIVLGSWTSPAVTSFSQTINWVATLGVGPHTLTATATDVSPQTATATLKILVEVPTIVFTQPTVTDVFGSSPVAVSVTSPAALSSVTIKSETGIVLGSWTSPTATSFSQTVAWAATLGAGPHTLTATATNVSPATATATLAIVVEVPTIVFTEPTITAGTSPAVADVSGTSAVAVLVTSPLPLTSVTIKYGSGSTLVSFPSPAPTTLSSNITWATTPGVGTFLLTATATCNDGETAQATLTVVVALPPCTTDANCATGTRCCATSGLCYPIVAAGADCDCQHPCPTSQGCFPGVCGAAPQQCRAGCFPGSWGPAPNYGLPADSCPNDPATGLPAYCAPLPASQATAANKGGACAPGDSCNVITQTGCSGLPLNRALPVSATNPVVPYNCVPVAPHVNGCIPAGPMASGAINCNGDLQPGATDSVCGSTTANCAVGLTCTQVVDSNGDALTPPTCSPQCATPTETCRSNGCGSGSFCDLTFTDGNVDFTTGTCLSDDFCDD